MLSPACHNSNPCISGCISTQLLPIAMCVLIAVFRQLLCNPPPCHPYIKHFYTAVTSHIMWPAVHAAYEPSPGQPHTRTVVRSWCSVQNWQPGLTPSFSRHGLQHPAGQPMCDKQTKWTRRKTQEMWAGGWHSNAHLRYATQTYTDRHSRLRCQAESKL